MQLINFVHKSLINFFVVWSLQTQFLWQAYPMILCYFSIDDNVFWSHGKLHCHQIPLIYPRYYLYERYTRTCLHGPLTRHVKLEVAHASGMPETFSPPPLVSDPDMHQGTYVTHVPWCMSRKLANSRFPLKSEAGKTFPIFPAHAQTTLLRILQEAHAMHG